MNKKSKIETFGIINIGASAFRMHVAEYEGDNVRTLDYLIKPLRLGADTFTQGYISLENVKRATEILNLFRLKLEEYGVKNYKALCTSGVREASNRDFFIDYAFLNSGIKLEILEPTEEIYIKYVGIKYNVPNINVMEQKGLMFANVSSGNVTLNITHNNRVIYAGTLPYGSLRLRQMFRSISHLKRHKAVEDYVYNMISSVSHYVDPNVKPQYLVGAGSSINLMLRLFDPSDERITRKQLETIYEHVKTMSLNEIAEDLDLRQDEASVLVPTIITYLQLMKMVGTQSFTFSRTSFPEVMNRYYSKRIKDISLRKRVVSTIEAFAERYRVNVKHAKRVGDFANKLFDKLHEIHFLDKRAKDILYMSALLNDAGKFLGDEDVAGNSFYIINAIKIPGLDTRVIQAVGNVVFEANAKVNSRKPREYVTLAPHEALAIKKIASILKVARSLDAGRKRNIQSIDIEVGDHIIINAHAETEPYLEMYTFDNEKQQFIETFGILIELRVRIMYD